MKLVMGVHLGGSRSDNWQGGLGMRDHRLGLALAIAIALAFAAAPARAGNIAVWSADLVPAASSDLHPNPYTILSDGGIRADGSSGASFVAPVRFPKTARRVTKIRINMKTVASTPTCDSSFSLQSLNMGTGETSTIAYDFMMTPSDTVRAYFPQFNTHELNPNLVYSIRLFICENDTFYGVRLSHR